ncbi:MAG: hypothetical protein GX764_08320 [Firmicutes bacterium]|nr:hypothetical protein [Bacillota bacterium]
MKKMLFVLFVALLMFGRAHAFERQEASLPVISEPLSRLETAVGWMKTPGGGWISRENRIPKYMSSDYDLLQDFNDYSLGVDNFQLLDICCKIKVEKVASENSIVLQLEIPQYCKSPLQA